MFAGRRLVGRHLAGSRLAGQQPCGSTKPNNGQAKHDRAAPPVSQSSTTHQSSLDSSSARVLIRPTVDEAQTLDSSSMFAFHSLRYSFNYRRKTQIGLPLSRTKHNFSGNHWNCKYRMVSITPKIRRRLPYLSSSSLFRTCIFRCE